MNIVVQKISEINIYVSDNILDAVQAQPFSSYYYFDEKIFKVGE